MIRKITRDNTGVNLIEMLVVVAIIGIIATIALPNFAALIKNHRLRKSSIKLLSAIRKERSRALSLSRQIEMTIDMDTRTYTVKKLAYTFYDPMQLSREIEDELISEPEEVLIPNSVENGSFDSVALEQIDVEVNLVPSSDPSVTLNFNPSGTLTETVTITLDDDIIQYKISIYKGGQITMYKL